MNAAKPASPAIHSVYSVLAAMGPNVQSVVLPIPFLACDSSRTSFIAHLMADSSFFGSRERGMPARTKARYALRRPAQLTVPMKPAIAAALRKGSIRWMARARACEGIEVDVWSRKSQEGQR